jgi:hypothetical protein
LEFAVRIVHFDEKRRIHKQAALPITEWFDVGCRQAWGGWPWAGRAGAWASSDSHARLCSGESAICGMPRVKVDAMRGNTSASAPSQQRYLLVEPQHLDEPRRRRRTISTSYFIFFVNLKDGPLVMEIPAAQEQALYGTLGTRR